MIENKNQLDVTKRWLLKFEDSLRVIEENKDLYESPLIYKFEVNCTTSMIADLKQQITDYDNKEHF